MVNRHSEKQTTRAKEKNQGVSDWHKWYIDFKDTDFVGGRTAINL